MEKGEFIGWLKGDIPLTFDTLSTTVRYAAYYPWCQTLRLLYLQQIYRHNDPSYPEALKKSALFIADRVHLFAQTEGQEWAEWETKWHQIQNGTASSSNDTLSLIDDFLVNVGWEDVLSSSAPASSDSLSPQKAQEYAAFDYLAMIDLSTDNLQQSEPLKGDDRITSFIQRSESGEMQSDFAKAIHQECDFVPQEPVMEEGFFTETLAQIYLKQKRYAKALEIFKRLILKYPEKSVYFADQIRFLELLINNANKK